MIDETKEPLAAAVEELTRKKLVSILAVDFDCNVCKRNFDFDETGGHSSAAWLVAHVKSCLASRAKTP